MDRFQRIIARSPTLSAVAIRNAVFHDYLALYRDAIRSTRYQELEDLQGPPYGDLAYGGAGTAYALWRLGETRHAKTWINAVVADRRAVAIDVESRRDARRSGLMFGRPGARWVQAMITPALASAYARALRTVELDEYGCGAAGHFTVAKLVPRDPMLARVIDRLGTRIVERVRERSASPWQAEDATGFAHGWPGEVFAALGHAPEEPWLLAAAARLAAAWTGVARPNFVASWCNGAAGSLLLWVRTFTLGQQGLVMDVARRTAEMALANRAGQLNLCCGDIGVAFALLALDRIDPRGGWRKQARTIAARVIAAPRFHAPNGLFHGHPGLVCLALDLVGDQARGFPAVES